MSGTDRGDGVLHRGDRGDRVDVDAGALDAWLRQTDDGTCIPTRFTDLVHPYTSKPLGSVVRDADDGDGGPDPDPGPDGDADPRAARASLLRGLDAHRHRRRVPVGDADLAAPAPAADVPDAGPVRQMPVRPGADERAAAEPEGVEMTWDDNPTVAAGWTWKGGG
jgi:hypothetical protein